ncbi:MAG: FG-GAP-like repeat-containing protein [Chthoniobacterales bacterium]
MHTDSLDKTDFRIGTGAAWFDYDRDGDLDLYMTNRVGSNRLWRNDGGGEFVEVSNSLGAADASHDGSGVTAVDYDNDGDLDLYLANSNADVLLKNQLVETGSPGFVDVTNSAFPQISTPQRGTSGSWGDYDKDGYLDLYVANHLPLPGTTDGSQDRLFHNNGNGTFTDVSSLLLGGIQNGRDSNLGGYGFIAGWTDFDHDGDLDIFLINDCPQGPIRTKFFRNDGGTNPLTWNFTEISESIGVSACRNGMGLAVGDYDRDGWQDYYYTNIGSAVLFRNNGGIFTDVTAAAGLEDALVPGSPRERVTWGTIFFDYDLDGFPDLCVAAGSLRSTIDQDLQPNLLYHNNGNGTFTDASASSGISDTGRGRTIIMGDYDKDGDPDLFLVNYGEPAHLYRNDLANTTGRHWLILDLQGAGPPLSNRDGVGARIKVTTPDGVTQYWETRCGTSLGGGDDMAAYFGLNNNTTVSSIQVTWPSGTVQTLSNVTGNQRMKITESGSTTPQITVLSPNGKENFVRGQTYPITWSDNLSENVQITLLNGRAEVAVLSSSTASDGSFDWTVPTTLTIGPKYKISIQSTANPGVNDQSDRTFRIR